MIVRTFYLLLLLLVSDNAIAKNSNTAETAETAALSVVAAENHLLQYYNITILQYYNITKMENIKALP